MSETVLPKQDPPPAEDVDPYKVAEVESPTEPGTLASSDASKLVLQQQNILKDLETQRVLTALNAAERGSIVAASEKAQAPLRDEAVQAMRAREAAAEQVASQPIPSIPAPPKVQDFLNRDTASMMAAVASLIAGFNSNGRIRGVRANQSLAGAVEGFMQGNLLRAKLGLEDWHNQVEQQLMEFKMIRQRNLDILSAKGMTIEDKLAEIQLANAPYQNEMMKATIEKQGIDGVLKIDKEMAGIIDATEKTLGRARPGMQKLSVEEMKWNIRARALGYPDISSAPPEVANQIMSDIAGLRAQAYQQERQKYQAWVRTDAPIEPKQVINWMDQNGQTPANDPKFTNPASMTPKALGDSGYRYFSDLNVARAYRQSMQALTQLKRIDKDVEELYSGVSPGMNIANALALKVKRGMGDARALQLRRTILETLPTMALAEGMTAGRIGEAILGEFELPQFPTDQDSYDSAKTAVKTLQQRLGNNINVFRGTGINPALVREATGLAETGQQMPGEPGLPPGGQLLPGDILVIEKKSGRKGLLAERLFDPEKYERVPMGQPVRAPTSPMRSGETEY